MTQRTLLIQTIQKAAFTKIEQDYGHLAYHNLTHTKFVLQSALQLADDRNLRESEQELLTLAASSHDVIQDHDSLANDYNAENEREAGEWLVAQMRQHPAAFSNQDMHRILIIIASTYIKHREDGLQQSALNGHQLSELLCDADLAALGSPWEIYEPHMKTYYQELHAEGTDQIWHDFLRLQVEILREHHYYTPEAQQRFHHLRENAEKIEAMIERIK
jgi:predicted metal-dependent HD superfamily phosphohydrolase